MLKTISIGFRRPSIFISNWRNTSLAEELFLNRYWRTSIKIKLNSLVIKCKGFPKDYLYLEKVFLIQIVLNVLCHSGYMETTPITELYSAMLISILGLHQVFYNTSFRGSNCVYGLSLFRLWSNCYACDLATYKY